MAIICRDHRLLYIQVPGTGCSVVGKLLRNELGGERLGRKHNSCPELLAKGLLAPDEMEDYLVCANIRNPYDRFVTYYQRLQGDWTEDYLAWRGRHIEWLRERGELEEAAYRKAQKVLARESKRKRKRARIIQVLGFNAWMPIALLRWRLRQNGRSYGDGVPQASPHVFPMLKGVEVAIRQERLDEGFNELLTRLGIERSIQLPVRNTTQGKKPYTAYYNTVSRRLIERLHGEALAAFGYTFEGPTDARALVDLRVGQEVR